MGNAYDAISDAFANDAVATLMDQGASADGAFGNDVAATFNLGSGLSKWFANVTSGGRQHIFIMGDSNTQHVPGGDLTRWSQLVRTDLLAFTGVAQGGEGYRHLGLPEWSASAGWIDHSTDPGIVGTTTDLGPYGQMKSAATQTPIMTWTKPATFAAFNRFNLYAGDDDFLAQTAEYSVDGGAFTAATFDFAPTLGHRLVQSTEVVAAPTTTLRVRPSTIFPTYFAGAAFYQATTGLVVHNLGLGGTKVSDATGVKLARRLALFDVLQPKLTIVWTGTNEALNFADFGGIPGPQMSVDAFYRDYLAIVQRARQYGDVLMVYPMASKLGGTLMQTPLPRQQVDFERAARKIAYDTDSGFVSIHALWGTWERHNARAFAADDFHLSTLGHQAVGKFLGRAIRRVS